MGHILRDKSGWTYLQGRGEKVNSPIIAWYIGGASKKIIVDTGTNAPSETAAFHRPLTRGPKQELVFALSEISVKPEEIEMVVITHLHWDHCYNNHLFPNARFYAQRRELEYAACPLPAHVHGYDTFLLGMTPPFVQNRWEYVDGDMEVVPGVNLILTPGHTPGMQGVLVKSASGNLLIASDTLPLFENWDRRGELGPIPHGVFTNLEDYYRSFVQLSRISEEEHVDLMLPGHDPLVFEVTHPSVRQLPAAFAVPV
jgi:glyoxylase-like metal-dependent hydrolase (beta-lactamase superfamily II)